MMWFRLLAVCIGIWGISGCAFQAERASSDTANQAFEADKAAVQALFDQPYIDPLTRFLKQPQGQQLPQDLQNKIRVERDRRCQAVAQEYAQRPLTAQSLARYRAGYQYSCPDDVDAFAERLKVQSKDSNQAAETASGQSDEVSDDPDAAAETQRQQTTSTASVGADAISSQQLNDCYLLTQIRNFSDALDACQEPAEKGYVKAQRNMAMMAYTLEDYERARLWAEKAASQSGQAANILGEMYAQGQGVNVDLAQARHWFLEAVRLGYAKAQSRLETLPADESQ
ncbi:tetratricopeptide repeat protein [Terasakiispira papahanaumokuakeensis]|nr:sel1 repeat family protein [Terasakiispira papahanaumokuakeensis]